VNEVKVFNPAIPRSLTWNRIDEPAALRTLNSFAVDLIGIHSAEDLCWYVAQNVVGRLNFVDCVIYQADEAQGVLRQVAAWGEKNPFATTSRTFSLPAPKSASPSSFAVASSA
jgi:hypothetical protein